MMNMFKQRGEAYLLPAPSSCYLKRHMMAGAEAAFLDHGGDLEREVICGETPSWEAARALRASWSTALLRALDLFPPDIKQRHKLSHFEF